MARGASRAQSETPVSSRFPDGSSDDILRSQAGEQLNQRSAQFFNTLNQKNVSQEDRFEQTSGSNYDKVKYLNKTETKNVILKDIKSLERIGFLRTTYPKEVFDGYKLRASVAGKYIPTMNIRAVYPAGHPISVAAEKLSNGLVEILRNPRISDTQEMTRLRTEWKESNEGSAALTLQNKIRDVIGSYKVTNIANDGSDSAGANFMMPASTVFYIDSEGQERILPR